MAGGGGMGGVPDMGGRPGGAPPVDDPSLGNDRLRNSSLVAG